MKNAVAAAETSGDKLCLYFHDGETFRVETRDFRPFVLLASDAQEISGCETEMLDGNGYFCRQAFFPSRSDYEKFLARSGKNSGVLVIRDTLQQALSVTDERLFCGIDFEYLRRMQFAVFSDDDSIISSIEVMLPNGSTLIFSGAEELILQKFCQAVKESDPDVLEGFDCCRRDLPLLLKRAEKLNIPMDCGRDGKGFSMRRSRYQAGEKQFNYQRFSLHGRHIADMQHAVHLYDAAHRDMEETDLAGAKEYFDITDDSRCGAIRKLSAILLPAYFYRTRELPLGFQESILRGSGSALDAMMIAEYLHLKRAIPLPEAPRAYIGAVSSMEARGVFRSVRHCDIRSLYPSLLLNIDQDPVRDEAGIFLKTLRRLRDFRLAAKDAAKKLPEGREKQQLQALQSSFKVLINSFYGYLGFAQGSFNDYDLAEKVTARGRELLGKLLEVLRLHNASVIELDTDGIYFCESPDSAGELDEALKNALPKGIDLEFDARYDAMYSYKAKNYALLHKDGTIHLTGAALKSRAMERFQREFIMEVLSAKLHGMEEKLQDIRSKWQKSISENALPLEYFAKSEILSDSPENYRKKLALGKTRRSAAYELALGSGRKFRAGDKIKYYVTGTKPKLPITDNARLLENAPHGIRDENTAYYLAKLDLLYETFCK